MRVSVPHTHGSGHLVPEPQGSITRCNRCLRIAKEYGISDSVGQIVKVTLGSLTELLNSNTCAQACT